MTNLKLVATDEKIISENYPYGFRLRTTKTDYLEFNPKHGFRHCYTTINPKTNKVNTPKKSTYSEIILLGTDHNNHCQSIQLDINGIEAIQKTIDFLKKTEHFDLFSNEQMHFIYMAMMQRIKADMVARKIYGGVDLELLKPLYTNPVAILSRGLTHNGFMNVFNEVTFDVEAIQKLDRPDYNPFVITERFLIN